MATVITALFDINRFRIKNQAHALKTIDEYLDWFTITLQLNVPMVIYTEQNIVAFIEEHRPKAYKTKVIVQKLDEIPYYRYYNDIKNIIDNPDFHKAMQHPDRIECVLPEYSIIQYSKFEWLRRTLLENPFDTEYFFWADAGISRFFGDADISKPFPSNRTIQFLNSNDGKIIAQARETLQNMDVLVESFLYTSFNAVIGTLFGGGKEKLINLADEVNKTFETCLLARGIINNEQLVLGVVWKYMPHLFELYLKPDKITQHLPLFKILCQC